MEKIPFAQTFIGAVLVAAVGGLIVRMVIEKPLPTSIEELFGSSQRPAAPPAVSAGTKSSMAGSEADREHQDAARSGRPELVKQNQGASSLPETTSPDSSVVSAADVSGTWTGEWSKPDGYLFTFVMHLRLSNETVVTGEIDWTFKLSPRLEHQRLIGLSAVEFVRGSVDPRSRVVMLQGYDKKDPHGVIALDGYRLSLSEDAQELSGKTYTQGTWEGVFVGRRP